MRGLLWLSLPPCSHDEPVPNEANGDVESWQMSAALPTPREALLRIDRRDRSKLSADETALATLPPIAIAPLRGAADAIGDLLAFAPAGRAP